MGSLTGILAALVLLSALSHVCLGAYSMRDFERDHMKDDHHVDEFTERSFFKMHDSDGDNTLDAGELEGLYSFHGSGDEVSDTTRELVRQLLDAHDFNGDGRLSEEEYLHAKGAKPTENVSKLQHGRRSRMNPGLRNNDPRTAGNRGAQPPRQESVLRAPPGAARFIKDPRESNPPQQPQEQEQADKTSRIPSKYAVKQ